MGQRPALARQDSMDRGRAARRPSELRPGIPDVAWRLAEVLCRLFNADLEGYPSQELRALEMTSASR
jgi:hypothetical protein